MKGSKIPITSMPLKKMCRCSVLRSNQGWFPSDLLSSYCRHGALCSSQKGLTLRSTLPDIIPVPPAEVVYMFGTIQLGRIFASCRYLHMWEPITTALLLWTCFCGLASMDLLLWGFFWAKISTSESPDGTPSIGNHFGITWLCTKNKKIRNNSHTNLLQ